MLHQPGKKKKEACESGRTLMRKHGWLDYAASSGSLFRLLKLIDRKRDFAASLLLFGTYRSLCSRPGSRIVEACARLPNLRGHVR